ncbi:MAG: methyltransferase domain-containing protein [Anaerolineales bacterium]|nr:methyltransferase domain-containing protein [Anaerolineales bacterium]
MSSRGPGREKNLGFERVSKYEVVARRTVDASGVLVDVGARDRVLNTYLRSRHLRYLSADLGQGHDFCWDLEGVLAVPDSAFDVVVALDVLEHVEHIHLALRELIRIARTRVFISLPNLAALAFRLHFLRHGQISMKHALLPEHQGDRHRWLTSYTQIQGFVRHLAAESHCQLTQYDLLAGYGRTHSFLARLPLPAALRTYTVLFELTKAVMPEGRP